MAEINRKNIDLDILDYYDGKIKVYIDDKVGTGGLTIDDSLSDTSKNPVQNKVITNALKGTNQVTDNSSYSLENSVYYPLLGLNLYGKSVQDGTPTPDAPVDIVSVGDNGFDIITKDDKHFNLLSVRDTGGDIITKQPVSTVAKVGKQTTFTVAASGTGLKYQWQWSADGTTWKNTSTTAASYSLTAVAAYNGYMYRCVVTDSNGNFETSNESTLYVVSDDCEVKTASIATDALPWCGIPVSSGGNYTDSTGQQWICDELVYNADGTGKIIKRTGKYTFTGSEAFELRGNSSAYIYSVSGVIKYKHYSDARIISSKYRCTSISDSSTTAINKLKVGEASLFYNTGYLNDHIIYFGSSCTTLANFKSEITGSRIIYPLAEPQEIELTAAEVDALRTLQTFNGVTNIYNNGDAEMDISYCVNKNISETVNPLYQGLYQNLLSHSHDVATTTVNGFMSASDKKALDILKNPSATCTTARSDLNKVIALDNFVLSTGTTIVIKFTDTGTSDPASGDITLNINNTGAKSIGYICNGVGVKITSNMGWMFCNGRVHSFRYNGISWECLNYNRDTWRGIQNNLTSDSTTDSLSAAQGKALKALVDGKAASSHKQAYTSDECVNFTSDDGTLGVTPAAVKKAISTFEPKSHTHSSYVNQNAFSNISVGSTTGSTTIAADTTTDTLTLVGSNVTLTPDATNDKVTIGITKANVTSALGYTPPTTNTTYSSKAAVSGGTDVSLVTTGEKYNWNAKASTAVATTSANGLMSSTDKSKLNGIESGAIRIHKALTSNGTTATTTKGYTYGVAGVTTSPYNYAKWYAYLDSGVTTLTNGMVISIRIPVAGCNYGCCITIDGGTTFKPVVYNTGSSITTNFGNGVELLLMYDSNGTGSVWSNSSSVASVTGVWRVMNSYDSGNTISSAMCYTAAGTAAKTATFNNYALLAKSYLLVNIVYSNTAKSALTMNINNQGAKPIHINGVASSSSNYTLPAGTYIAYYDGTRYCFRTDGKIPANISGDASTINGLTVQTAVPANAKFTDTVYTHPTTSGNKHIPSGGSSGQILRWSADGTAVWGNDNNTTYSNFVKSGSGAKSGLVPAPPTTAGATKYLREDGAWVVPTNTWRAVVDNLTTADATKSLSANQGKVLKGLVDGKASSSHTHNAMTGATADVAGTSGFVPAPTAGNQNKFLKADGTWSSLPSIGSSVACIVNGTGSSFTYEGNYRLFFYNIKGINIGFTPSEFVYESKNGWLYLPESANKVTIKLAYYTYQTGASTFSTVNYYLEIKSSTIRIVDSTQDYGVSELSGVTLEVYGV